MSYRPGNPQGKGVSNTLGLLQQVQASSALPDVNDDGLARIVEDYLSSLLIVSCEFKFKPVPGVSYYLYLKKGRLLLSLISPEEGGDRLFDGHVGSCLLKKDLSWSVTGIRTEPLRWFFDPDLLAELEYSAIEQHCDLARLHTLLRDIKDSANWHFECRLGYYQNVMLFLVQKTLRYRLKRLRESGAHLGTEERKLLLSL